MSCCYLDRAWSKCVSSIDEFISRSTSRSALKGALRAGPRFASALRWTESSTRRRLTMSFMQTPAAANAFASKVYEAIDSMDEQAFANCLTENCTFVFANSDPVIGRANAAAASQNFLNQLAGIKHHLLNVWAFEVVIVSQISVTYPRKDGTTLTVPAVTIWKLRDRLIDESRIYIDISPLFER